MRARRDREDGKERPRGPAADRPASMIPQLPFELVSSGRARADEVRIDLDHSTLADRVYQHLRREILATHLQPGMPLREVRIARSLGVSRAPVRDAVRRLAAERLVQLTPRRGAVVAALSLGEFLDAYQLREGLEALAIRLAAPRLTEADLAELKRWHRLMAGAAARDDADAYFKANTAFHNLFVNRSGNRRLHESYMQLINEMRRYRMRSVALRGGLSRSNSEHEAIIKALEARDAERAARLVSEHIRVPQDALRAVLEQQSVPVALSANRRRRERGA